MASLNLGVTDRNSGHLVVTRRGRPCTVDFTQILIQETTGRKVTVLIQASSGEQFIVSGENCGDGLQTDQGIKLPFNNYIVVKFL